MQYVVGKEPVFFSLSSGPAVSQIESTVNRKPKSAPHQQMAEILLMFSFGVAHPCDPLFLELKFGTLCPENEFFKANMDALPVLSIWDTAGSSSMISHCHGTC